MIATLLLARLVLGVIFLMSAVPKLATPSQFANDVQQYRILPRPLASAFGYALPYVELATAALLLTGFYASWAAACAAIMLVAFMLAVGVAMARKINLTCSCFGLLYRERVGWTTQLRDGVLLALSLFIIFAANDAPTLTDMLSDPWRLTHSVGIAATALALAAGFAVAFLSMRLARRPHAH